MQGSGAGSCRKGCCAGFWRVVNSVQCLKGRATTCHPWMQSP